MRRMNGMRGGELRDGGGCLGWGGVGSVRAGATT